MKTSWEAFIVVSLGASCAVLIWAYRNSADPDHRRRNRWFAFGCAAAFVPELVLNLTGLVLKALIRRDVLATGHRDILASWGFLRWIADSLLVAIPISLTFAVLKHRLLDIHLVVRRSLKYLMARRVLQVIVVLPFLGLTLPIALNPNRTLLEALRKDSSILNMILLVLGVLILIYRRQINTWLDKKFFRSAYRQE